MKSAIVAVGTELTDGQIINRNAAWIASRLKDFGWRGRLHLTVPDDRELILKAFDLAAEQADLLVVTGGLGPTTDDFTRDLVAKWTGCELEFHEPSWQQLIERLTQRNFPVHDFQKQQCFFPRGATVLVNSQGTANGFRLRAKDRHVLVLPGPPREIESIWNDHVRGWMTELSQGLDPVKTLSWDVLGLGESQVAELAEPHLKGQNVESGYRVHLPYVEFKLMIPQSRLAEQKALITKIDDALKTWTVARDGEDAAENLSRVLRDFPTWRLRDEVTGSYLMQRLNVPLRENWSSAGWTITSLTPAPTKTTLPVDLDLWITPLAGDQVRVGLRRSQQNREWVVEAPMKASTMAERRKQYFAEMAILLWARELATS